MPETAKPPKALSGDYRPFVREAVTQHVRQQKVWTRPHGNMRFELWTVREGSLLVSMNAEGRIRVPEGRSILIQPGTSTDLIMAPGCAYHRMRFDLQQRAPAHNTNDFDAADPDGLQPDLAHWWGITVPCLLPDELVHAATRAHLRIADLYWRNPIAHEQANQHLGGWILELVRHYSDAGAKQRRPDTERGRLMTLAYEMATRGTSVSECAEAWGMSRSHFTRHFEKVVGVPPGEFMRRARVEEVKKRLLAQDQPLESVAQSTGYKSAHALVQQFKAVTGTTPKAWQRTTRSVGES